MSDHWCAKVNQANALYYLGCTELAEVSFAAAEKSLQQALALRREIPHLGRLAEIQTELALSHHLKKRIISGDGAICPRVGSHP